MDQLGEKRSSFPPAKLENQSKLFRYLAGLQDDLLKFFPLFSVEAPDSDVGREEVVLDCDARRWSRRQDFQRSVEIIRGTCALEHTEFQGT